LRDLLFACLACDAEEKHCPPLCHPERTRISCHAAQDKATCAPFSKERSMKFANATKFNRKSGVAEGSAVLSTRNQSTTGGIGFYAMFSQPDFIWEL
jgi:hypothetical protein